MSRTESLRPMILLALVLPSVFTGCCDEAAIPATTDKLYSSEAKVRNRAALDLARCGDSASRAVGRLSQLLYDENVGVQSSAAYALRKIDTKEARASLRDAESRRRSR